MKYNITILLLISVCFSSFGQWGFNRPPTIDPIPNYGPIAENSGYHIITLSGISPGKDENSERQNVVISAITDGDELITELNVHYDQGTTAILSFSLKPEANGKAKIVITLFDGQFYNHTTEEKFEVRVFAVNGPPNFNIVTDSFVIDENVGAINNQYFALDIEDGDPELDQKLTFETTIISKTEHLSFKNNPKIDKNGTLKFEVETDSYGSATVSVYLKDDGGTKNGGIDTSDEIVFIILVNKINDPPTIDEIASPVILMEDSGDQLIELTGISSGIDEDQPLAFSVVSSNQQLITNPVIEYLNGDDKALLRFSTKPNMFGETYVTITLNDGQKHNNITSIQCLIQVKPVADTPIVSGTTTELGIQSNSGLIINRNSADGDEVTHWKITNIVNGALYLNDGVTQIIENQFITFSQGIAGLKFTPFTNISSNGSFNVQAAIGAKNIGLGGEVILAVIIIDNDPPTIISVPDSNVNVSEYYSYEITSVDPDINDELTYEFVFPDIISGWLNFQDNNDGTALISGVPPENSEGTYQIDIKVIDQFGEFFPQSFVLIVKELNHPPELAEFTIHLLEDEPFYLDKSAFEPWFFDLDGDSIRIFRLEGKPIYGKLFLSGIELEENDMVELTDFTQIEFIPSKNYFGLDVIEWNASDGKDFARFPKRISFLIESVNDPPVIQNFENWTFEYDLGQDRINLTTMGNITDADSEKLLKAEINIENYQIHEDLIEYEIFGELEYTWKDTLGVLSIKGLADLSIYEQAIRSLRYSNQYNSSPSGNHRNINIILHDLDTSSAVYTRTIEFVDTFAELEIPSGFTPNDDGVNDTWSISNLGRCQECKIMVFSRNGKKIFDTKEGSFEWDGSYNGDIVSTGTYYYLININQTKVLKGTITVLR